MILMVSSPLGGLAPPALRIRFQSAVANLENWTLLSTEPSRPRFAFGLLLLLLSTQLTAVGCLSTPSPIVPDTESTAVLLDRIAASIGPEVPFHGERLVVERLLEFRDDPTAATFEKRLRLAQGLVRVGRPEEAVELYDQLLVEARSSGFSDAELIDKVEFPRAVAYLRLGEQENCIAHHTVDSCLFPIRAGAVHGVRRGSTAAVAAFEAILERRPDDLVVKWLLNVASMTLGRGPETIRSEWRIDPTRYRPKRHFAAFEEVAGPLGLAVNGLSGGCIVDDFDGDGDLDLMASAVGPIGAEAGQLRLFRNGGDGSFEDATEEAGLLGIRGGLNLVHADYDNNGFLDVLVLRGAWQLEHGKWPNTLLRNDGGKFSDVTVRAGVLGFEPTQAAAWGDFDSDGLLDLFIGIENGIPSLHEGFFSGLGWSLLLAAYRLGHPEVQAHLYRNRGDGTFEDIFPDFDLDLSGWIKGAVFCDYDRDGRVDLYLSRYGARNVLLHNDGPGPNRRWAFSDVTERAGVGEPIFSFPTWFFDYDNDGWDDLYVGGYPKAKVVLGGKGQAMELRMSPRNEIADFLGLPGTSDLGKPRLYRNRGDGTFADVTRESGLWLATAAMGANFGDLDNDGFLDFYLGTGTPPFDYLVPNRAFHNQAGRSFADVTVAANLGSLAKGHGVSFADIDDDGDQDIYTVLGGAFPADVYPNALFENPGFGNDWISIRLAGTSANRAAVGAKVTVHVTGRSGKRKICRTIGSGGSFGGSTLRAEIGLGKLADDDAAIEEVEITWPDRTRTVQKLGPLRANTAYTVRQGDPAEVAEPHRICLKAD